MRTIRLLTGVAGLASVAAAFALVTDLLAPVPPLSALLAAVDAGRYLLGLAAALLVVGLWFARRGPSTTEGFTKRLTPPPEVVAAPAPIRVGGEFDRLVAERARSEEVDAMAPVASRLREVAVDRYADAAAVDRSTARRRVEDGEWTDDALASAFLAGTVRFPFRSRIRAWLDPSRERRRRVDAAVDALFELRDGAVPDGAIDPDGDGDDDSPAESAERGRSWVTRVTDGGREARR